MIFSFFLFANLVFSLVKSVCRLSSNSVVLFYVLSAFSGE